MTETDNKKNEKNEGQGAAEAAQRPAVFSSAVLLAEPGFDAEAFAKAFENDWGRKVTFKKDAASGAAVFDLESALLAVEPKEGPAPDAEQHAATNPAWSQGAMMAGLAKAHLTVAAFRRPEASPLEAATDLVKATATLSRLPKCLAIDTGSTLLSPDAYRDGASVAEEKGGLPLFCLVSFVVAGEPDGRFSAVTLGLSAFLRREIEVLPSEQPPEKIREFLLTVAEWEIRSEKDVAEGTPLGLGDKRTPAAAGASRFVEGLETLQVTL
ncbi:MAG: hypothetical protein ACFWTZ_08420 [Burkholderia sp.]|jgi:hypothetical protein